jgi:hypothetical protein
LEAAFERLNALAEAFDQTTPARVREHIRRLVGRVTLYFGQQKKGTRTECPSIRGFVDLKPDPVFQVLSMERSELDYSTFRNPFITRDS